MLMCRRLLLIAAAITASIEAGSASYHPGISSDYSGFPGLAVYSGLTSSGSPSSSVTTSATSLENVAVCRPSEYLCGTGNCVAQDKYCDGENDCGDKSDEPRYCTQIGRVDEGFVRGFSACNRTLYGDVGRTYRVEVRRPREDRLPFLCHLNFTAAGSDLGDLVQLTFDTFTVGRFISFTSEGCPDGYMTIREEGRPATGGQWCGSAWGYTVYYSETPSINLTLYLLRLSEQGNGYNFDFKMSYKFLRRSEAHLRYGNSSMSTWRGELVNGTYCDRVLTKCDTRACRLQSPNYPGVYPRNVTCYYRVEQNRAPPGHRALLAVSQRNSHKIHIKDQLVKYDRSQRILRVWDQCNVVQDYLTVYDGGSTSDKVLVRLCGGDAVPDIVSSHNTMLLEFHTSPYDNPFHPVPLSFLPGFELEVQVLFVDEKSRSFVKENNNCDFYISSEDSSSGVLENPKHSLPPNTTCRYHFQGKPHEIVWLSFVKYYAASAEASASIDVASDCNATLLIWDGDHTLDKGIPVQKNITLLGQFCKDDTPRLCDHSLLRNGSRHTRPCSLAESYVSTSRDLTLEHILRQGSALYPISFVLRYEFVHEANVSCVYRFEAEPDHRIELTVTRASFGNKGCSSYVDPLVNRWTCDRRLSDTARFGTAELVVAEYPWQGVELVRDCLCSNVTEKIILRTLTSNTVEVRFTVSLMNVTQDYRDFFFEGEYRFVPLSAETSEQGCSTKLEERRLRGTSGEISLRSPLPRVIPGVAAVEEILTNTEDLTATQCVNEPWLIEPEDVRINFLYLRTAGYSITLDNVEDCTTLNRIVVYSASNTKDRSVICPEGGVDTARTVDFFSGGWNYSAVNASVAMAQHSRSFVVEFLQREPGFYAVTWMAISKRSPSPSTGPNVFTILPQEECPYRCPEIQACISSVLWCDGIRHCPSGFDEEEANCSYRFGVTLLYVAVGAGALGIFLILLLATGCLKYCLYRHKARKKKKNVALNVNHLHVNHTHHNNGLTGSRLSGRYNLATPQEMYLENYGKDSIC
ncbi:CUB domain-containing protein 2 [Dufourea novaeangliae]|uniref:CUB domain-containing protein 2 n=1 Tax=Dufourea novaeangliae TaxID=178035 RepID=A0A154P0K5_DUFNO|nr:CUB domain-containing protein 2 [Dufourea novaeangliae]